MQRNAVLKAYLKKGVGPLVVADSGGAAPVLNTLLSWSLTLADCSRPDVVNGHGAGPVAIGEGVQLWSDMQACVLTNLPAELEGGLIYQFSVQNYDDFTVSVNAVPARVYILYEDGRNDDLIQLLGNEGWTLVSPFGFVNEGNACADSQSSFSSCVTYMPSIADDTGGWILVRHLPPGNTWHPATDRLQGTETYGTPGGASAWSVPFGDFNEFLFASGDKSMWLITTRTAAIGEYYENAPRDVLKSSISATPYQARWYHRTRSEDPWISLTDHSASVTNGQLLYGGNSYGGGHASFIAGQGGMNVFVRNSLVSSTPKPMSYGVKLVSSPTSFWFPSTSSERLMGVVIVSEAATTVQVQHNPCCLARALAPRSPILCLCLFCVRLCVAA